MDYTHIRGKKIYTLRRCGNSLFRYVVYPPDFSGNGSEDHINFYRDVLWFGCSSDNDGYTEEQNRWGVVDEYYEI
jgi:hypothetical protein